MRNLIGKSSLIIVVGATLLLGGCATKESVEQAQSTADSAVSAAQKAQGAAQTAAQKADQAEADAQAAGAKIDQFIQDERKESTQERRHHPRRHYKHG